MKSKNSKTRQGCFSLLSQLLNVIPGALNNHFAQVVPGIQYSLNDKMSTSNMKIDTLNFLNHLLLSHDAKLFHPYLDVIMIVRKVQYLNFLSYFKLFFFCFQPVIKCIQDSFYKIASDALLVSQQLALVLRGALDEKIKCTEHILNLYNATLVRLKQTDIDQEVKERAIVCM